MQLMKKKVSLVPESHCACLYNRWSKEHDIQNTSISYVYKCEWTFNWRISL